ncbi:peptidyl-tRNA hydrolase ICT1, mitochondrial [Megalobrama amblycephala]|uniref:peptidyl-tRNA hydrolase ICT1, mitochondrial n=1 Tax=Megalobrama amblycephala TaxID=75352 RepID=UPI0020142C99|nr:peptidyl-tRNA hydrolase ICT1, mitochondrial [Megalobrama amblycephala]
MAAASMVTSFCFLQLNNLSCSRNLCRRLLTVFSSGKTRLKLYADSSDFHMKKASHFTQEDLLSHIPVDKLKITYSRSSGPGGQHVNKVSTKAEVRFHVQTAEWIPEEVRREILLKNKTRVNKAGELIVTSEMSRSQQRNLEDCLQKISEMIAAASQRRPEPEPEDLALRAHRLDKRNLERLKQKKIHAATKQARRVDFD